MGDKDNISIVDLYAGQKVIVSRLDHIEDEVNKKHIENRNSIHSLRNMQQTISDDVWKLKIKIAGYSSVAGVLTALAVKMVEVLFKK